MQRRRAGCGERRRLVPRGRRERRPAQLIGQPRLLEPVVRAARAQAQPFAQQGARQRVLPRPERRLDERALHHVALGVRAAEGVQPVALRFARDGRRLVDAGFRHGESFFANIVRLLGEAPMDAEIHFLPPVPSTPDARRRMAELSRERIAAALDDKPA